MVLDIIILFIFVLSVVKASKTGFTKTVINFMQGGVSLICAIFFRAKLANFLWDDTFLGTWIQERISDTVSKKITESGIYTMLPGILKPTGQNLSTQIISEESKNIGFMLISILSFFIIYFILRLVFTIILNFAKRNKKKGNVISLFDKLLGGVIGIIIGVFSVFIFLALLPTITGIFMPAKVDYISQLLSDSLVAKDLYDNNLVLLFFKNMI